MSKKKSKSAKIIKRPPQMSIASSEKTRLVLSCTEDEKRFIKILAAIENQTISDYLLAKPRKKIPHIKCAFPGCHGIHVPNKETEEVFRDTDAGRNLESHDSLDDFWKSMGMKPNARS